MTPNCATRLAAYAASAVLAITACSDTARSNLRTDATIPSPSLPSAPWSAAPAAPVAGLGDLPTEWYEYFAGDSGCPLLAPNASPEEIGAEGIPKPAEMGNASSGPYWQWPGPGAPSLYIVLPPLTIGDPILDAFYASDATVVEYQDGSVERIPGDGSFLVLLPGVKCAYMFTPPDVHVSANNLFGSLRIIDHP